MDSFEGVLFQLFLYGKYHGYSYYYISCEYIEVQAQLAAVLGLHSTRSRVSVASIASFAANINTQTAYKQFCRDLYQIGVTEDMICRKENEILEILGSQGMVARSRMGGSNAGDQGQ